MPKKRKCNNLAPSSKRSRKHIDMNASTANKRDVLSLRRRPFSLIKNGLQARTLMRNWLVAASSHQSPASWYGNLAMNQKEQVRKSIGPADKKVYKTLKEYKQEYFCVDSSQGTVIYRLAIQPRPRTKSRYLIYCSTSNADGEYVLTRSDKIRAVQHLEEDWEPAERLKGPGLVDMYVLLLRAARSCLYKTTHVCREKSDVENIRWY